MTGVPKKLKPQRILMREIFASIRLKSFEEVNEGYTFEMAREEATRCLFCKKPLCIQGCPVGIDIPGFIRKIVENDLPVAHSVLRESNPLPAVCGRVCPQETQCEAKCVVGRKGDPVAIGWLERFVGDWGIDNLHEHEKKLSRQESGKVAIIGSGPAGLACAHDLARAGLSVTIFEALHEAGGVLAYGIPAFRLRRKVVYEEISALQRLGVHFEFNVLIGRLFTIEQLLKEKGFQAVFIGTGAGLPKFMGIPGEHLCGVMSANEFLTRANLMHGTDHRDTPVGMGKTVAVIGAGNTALDSARIALRLGASRVQIVYRRTEKESPARIEELRHAKEEGIDFQWLTNPVALVGDAVGRLTGMKCVRMELGAPDESGRRAPRPVPGSEFLIDLDTVIYALGTVANPIIGRTTLGLKTNRWGYIEIDPETAMTSLPGVFAGGDIVTGAATVILALGAGRRAARGILSYIEKLKTSVLPGREEVDRYAVSVS
ncbi:MAG: NADPH-dependent glutamate synthase [Deltaproteobacteria bacterium]|nr:NADPH-dependent glutamate synthase [Deltaproteobacteria bacterium]